MEIKTMDKVLAANDAWAAQIRSFLKTNSLLMVNLIGSPGAGKTTLLEKTIDLLGPTASIGVIEGDIATLKDAERIQKKDIPVYQINTGTACHLDAHLVYSALQELVKEHSFDYLFVENIGNLVCPAEFDIGEWGKIAVLSVTEGDDKVEKYPLLFSEAQALIITKTGLLEYTNFNLETVYEAFRKLNPKAPILQVDSLNGKNIDTWIDFLKKQKMSSR